MRKLVLFILFLLICSSVQAQCPDGNINLGSQQAINDFVSQYPNCTEIAGNVHIGSSDVNDLSTLTQLTKVEGKLEIRQSNLTNLQGLNNLTSVGTLDIYWNPYLVNLTGLESLSTADLVLIGISYNFFQDLIFYGNDALTSLEGLNNLSSLRGLYIKGNHALTDLSALSNLTSMQTLHLEYNQALSHLTGLENLTSLESLKLWFNSFLTSLTALENLTSVKNLSISNSYSLVSLLGLENIEPDSLTSVAIASNPNLAFCQLANICSYISNGGDYYIQANSPDCNDFSGTIQAACDLSGPCSIILTNQAEVNSFATDYPNCTELGYLAIISPAVYDLSPLSQITSVEGALLIERTNLTNLTGLNNLTSVGYLTVTGNDVLVNLTGLENLTTAGSVLIGNYSYTPFTPDFNHLYINDLQNKALINLTGLDNLSSVSNYLFISRNENLIDLTALNNLTTIGEGLYVAENENLTALTGLNNLTTIGEDLCIEQNENLTALTGLNNLTTIGEDLNIDNNDNLVNLIGLNNLTTIEDLNIKRNDNLGDLTALNNLTKIERGLRIEQNNNLVSLSGLQNIESDSMTFLSIRDNDNLSVCEVASICNYLETGGPGNVFGNAPGCNSKTSVEAACNLSGQCDIILTTQAEVNSFATDYPNCTQLGYLVITSPAIHDLSPLSQITSIGSTLSIEHTGLTDLTGLENVTSAGSLVVSGNDALGNLTGLENLTTASLVISNNLVMTDLTGLNNLTSATNVSIRFNPALINLNGLENLNSVGNDFIIFDNINLSNLTGLESLISIGNNFNIRGNDSLNDISGIQNINLNTLTGILHIVGHPLLSVCNLPNICNYLENEHSAFIVSNAPNCDSPREVSDACDGIFRCPVGDILLASQQDINDFVTQFPYCTEIIGNMQTNSTAINDLNSLNQLISIAALRIEDTDLVDLTGLNNVTSIQSLIIAGNDALVSLEGLENITTLDNHNALTNLVLDNNPLLSVCNLPNICDYLENENASNISNNATNCNTAEEVLNVCQSLPIELDKLQVQLENQTALLTWRTITETNNSGFEIQRSKDGINWTRIGWQAGQGTTTSSHSYTYRDTNPLFGTSYYRLKQVDIDGDFEYSNAVSLRYIPAVLEISPNPSEGIFQVNGIPQGTYQIHDTTGRIIQSGNMQNDISIDISQEARGVYFISIQIENETITKRIIKM